MSCDAAAAAVFIWLASAQGTPAAAPLSPEPKVEAGAVAYEPLFADIIKRAGGLKAQVEAYRAGRGAADAAFKREIQALSELDMTAHLTLAKRGTDGDLKCILKGISQDLPLKLQALEAATTPKERDLALSEMSYLLSDNVEVITAPPAPPV